MSNIKETVTTKRADGIDDSGNVVRQQAKEISTSAAAGAQSTISNFIWLVVGIIETLLLLRFVMKLLGANPASGFVDFIYSVTGVLTAPFDNIFRVSATTSGTVHSVFEPSIIVAALVYALIGWGIIKLININRTTE